MKCFFMDFENVHADGFTGLDKLDNGSVVFVMYSENCKNISWDIMEKAESKGIKISAYRAMTGSKNALDFQLSSLLGYVIGKNEEKENMEYIIISKDAGYDMVVEFWKRKGEVISRFTDLSCEKTNDSKKNAESKKGNEAPKKNEKKTESAANKKASKEILQTTKEEMLIYLTEDEFKEELLDVVNSYKTKQAINTGFSKLLKDSKKSGAIYKKLKPLFKEKNKS